MAEGLTVQQSAEKTGLSVHTIRYYERIGLIPSIGRADNGHRRYSNDDIGWIEFVKCLRSTGMPISDMQRYVELQKDGDSTLKDRLALLEEHRVSIESNIDRLREILKRIEWKISHYKGLIGGGNGGRKR
jgi:DNA-binding transcriptional MerR regulator